MTTSAPEFSNTYLQPAEIEEILRRIDENLALRRETGTTQSTAAPRRNALPPFGDLPVHLQVLRGMRAPLFAVTGGGVKNLMRRIINQPLKVIHYKQIAHNRQLLDLLDEMLIQIQALRQSVTTLDQAQTLLEQQAVDAEGHTLAEHVNEQLTRQQNQIAQQREQFAQLQEYQAGQSRWLEEISKELRGQSEWTRLIQRKMEMLALDVRELGDTGVQLAQTLPEPRIVDPMLYAHKLAVMDGPRLNLGAGEKPLPGYLNVDFRELPETDIVADVRRLPFEPATVAEIASAHLVEHFREHQLRRTILPYWYSLLQDGGIVRIICPNWEAMLARLNDGRLSLAEFKLLTFGGQDYEGDDHFAMYTPETLSALLQECGFQRIEIIASDRMNGICPEMELIAYR